MKKIKVAGLRQVLQLSQIEVRSLPSRADSMLRALAPLAENGINLEFVVAHSNIDETRDLILGVQRDHIAASLGLLQGVRDKFGLEEIRSRDQVGMLSLFPHGNRAAVIGAFLSSFRDAGIPILAISVSLSALSALIDENRVAEALSALGDYFELPG